MKNENDILLLSNEYSNKRSISNSYKFRLQEAVNVLYILCKPHTLASQWLQMAKFYVKKYLSAIQ